MKSFDIFLLSLVVWAVGIIVGLVIDEPETIFVERVVIASYDDSQKCKNAQGKLFYKYNLNGEDLYECKVPSRIIKLDIK